MKCCNSNPFVPQPHNVIWLCDGQEVPDGWIETSRFDFGCVSAVSVWPAGMDAPDYSVPVVEVAGGAVSSFTRDGVSYTQIVYRQSGHIEVSSEVDGVSYALGGGGASSANGWNRGGGGAGGCSINTSVTIPAGRVNISIGAGGLMGALVGSSSILSGALSDTALGGGMGAGGSIDAGSGANGGGGSQSGAAGVGISHSGGIASSTRSGGGAGAGGDGQNGDVSPNKAGNGGVGVTISFMNPQTGVCGGGGGSSDRVDPNLQGFATHGGTNGVNSGNSDDADWGGGSGGVRVFGAGNAPGKGGDGFAVFVFPSDRAVVVVV